METHTAPLVLEDEEIGHGGRGEVEKRIRLCKIEEANQHDPITCTLTSTILDHQAHYKCLSYVWGSQLDSQLIILDGKESLIGRNLYAALQRLRDSGLQSYYWIDALCIDQQDAQDKRVQVAMMDLIFNSAEEVLVWLGEDAWTANPWKAAALSPAVEECLVLLAKDAHFHDLPFRSFCKSRRCPFVLGDIVSDGHDWAAILAALRGWFDVAWFDRAWTVQEIVLARQATLILGAHRVSWETVSRAWVNLGKHMRTCCTECVYGLPDDDSEHIYRMASRIIDLATARRKLEEGQHLIEPLLQFSWKNTTDPRDKLYGLLGLQSGRRPTPVIPDYAINLQTLFSRFAADVVRTQGWLAPLCLDLRQELEGLASWVPDWTVQPCTPAVYTISRFVWSYSYSAAKGFAGNAIVDLGFALEVDSLLFDTIASVGASYKLTEVFTDQLEILQSWKDMLDLDFNAGSGYIGGGDLDEAFWRTMFADRFHENEKPRQLAPEDVEQLQDFLEEALSTIQEYGADAIIGLNDAMSSHIIAVLDRRLFRTANGYIGVCPKAAEVGDDVFVLGDCPAPIVLRRDERVIQGAAYVALGHCYVHGMMYGEAVDKALPSVRMRIV